jgi:WD40 repeat protein
VTPVTPPPAPTPQPFPTPAFPQPVGQRPEQLRHLWFPYLPDSASTPQLRAALVDDQGQRWAQSDRLLSLTLRKPQPGPDPGPILVDMHVSPNYRWMVADFAYVGSQLVDMSSGIVQPLVADSPINNWQFWAWAPDSQHILISSDKGFLLLDLVSHEYETIDFPKEEFSDSLPTKAVAYSPDGKLFADAVTYPPVYQVRNVEMTEIGVRDKDGKRKVVVQIPGGTHVVEHSLKWSPDGHRLIWIADVVSSEISTSMKLADIQSQLWLAEPDKGIANTLTILGKAVEYVHPAIWSPDGQYIAVIKIESRDPNDEKTLFANVHLIDPETGKEQQLTHFANRQVSHLAWSPDGQTLAFTVSGKDYGEIWVTNLDGTRQHPVAGPTTPNAPFVWLSGR